MTNLEKMNELVEGSANKEQIKTWAYMNRILVTELEFEEEFESMKPSIDHFLEHINDPSEDDELSIWEAFLDAEYID